MVGTTVVTVAVHILAACEATSCTLCVPTPRLLQPRVCMSCRLGFPLRGRIVEGAPTFVDAPLSIPLEHSGRPATALSKREAFVLTEIVITGGSFCMLFPPVSKDSSRSLRSSASKAERLASNNAVLVEEGQPRSTVVAPTHRFKTPNPALRRPSVVGKVAEAAHGTPTGAGEANILTIDPSDEAEGVVDEYVESPKRQKIAVASTSLTVRPNWPAFMERVSSSQYFDSASVCGDCGQFSAPVEVLRWCFVLQYCANMFAIDWFALESSFGPLEPRCACPRLQLLLLLPVGCSRCCCRVCSQ